MQKNMEAHSLKRAETGGEDNNLLALSYCPTLGLVHPQLCTLNVSFVRATTAGGGGEGGQVLTAASQFRVQRSRRECAELRGPSA